MDELLTCGFVLRGPPRPRWYAYMCSTAADDALTASEAALDALAVEETLVGDAARLARVRRLAAARNRLDAGLVRDGPAQRTTGRPTPERVAVQERLRAAVGAGQLERHEFDERARTLWAAKTRGELQRVTLRVLSTIWGARSRSTSSCGPSSP